MNNLKLKFENALNKFVEKYKKDPNVIGIIVSGSYIHSVPDKNSDIDVYILLKDSEMRERGNTFVDGVEIEYFINPIKQVEQYFEKEKGDKSPATAHMFANSRIIYKKGSILDSLIKKAKKRISAKKEKMNSFEIELARYFIDDLIKDLEDVYLRKDNFAFSIIANETISRCLEVFYNVKRLRKEKSKRLRAQIKKIDPKFEKILSDAISKNKFAEIKKLTGYTEKLLGGKRPKEWKLVSKCTYLSK